MFNIGLYKLSYQNNYTLLNHVERMNQLGLKHQIIKKLKRLLYNTLI